MHFSFRRSLLALLLLIAVEELVRADANRPTADDESLLQAAKMPTDGPGLLQFFRQQTLSDTDQPHIKNLVEQLGDKTFRAREKAVAELIAVGPKALPLLRGALQDPDLETKRRAEKCVQIIEGRYNSDVLAAAARLLQERRPAGACPVLLDYLPSAKDQMTDEAVLGALWTLGVQDGKVEPALAAALHDHTPVRRAAAALVLGRFGNAAQRIAVRKLLTDDNPLVRLRAAQGLLADRDTSAIPVLVDLLGDGPLELAQQAEDLLSRVAAGRAPAAPLAEDAAARRKCHDAWQRWWQLHQADVGDLAHLDQGSPLAHPTWYARAVAQRFLTALLKGDFDSLPHTMDVPFALDGVAVYRTQDEFNQTFRPVLEQQKKTPTTFSIVKVGKAEEYGKINPNLRTFLNGLPRSEVLIMYIQSRKDGGLADSGALIVRVHAAQARVVGIGQATPDQMGK